MPAFARRNVPVTCRRSMQRWLSPEIFRRGYIATTTTVSSSTSVGSGVCSAIRKRSAMNSRRRMTRDPAIVIRDNRRLVRVIGVNPCPVRVIRVNPRPASDPRESASREAIRVNPRLVKWIRVNPRLMKWIRVNPRLVKRIRVNPRLVNGSA